jgi:uncharacterized membrane protein (DUF106 family)
MQPFIELLAWSVLLAFFTALLYRLLTKPSKMKEVRQRIADLKTRANQAQKAGDIKESTRLTTEMLKANQETFRLNMKPMMVSMLLFIFILGWLASQYGPVKAYFPGGEGNFTYRGVTTFFNASHTGAGNDSVVASMILDGNRVSVGPGGKFTYAHTLWATGFGTDDGGGYMAIEPIISAPLSIPFIGETFNWFWWYFIVVIAGNFIFRKLLGVE